MSSRFFLVALIVVSAVACQQHGETRPEGGAPEAATLPAPDGHAHGHFHPKGRLPSHSEQ